MCVRGALYKQSNDDAPIAHLTTSCQSHARFHWDLYGILATVHGGLVNRVISQISSERSEKASVSALGVRQFIAPLRPPSKDGQHVSHAVLLLRGAPHSLCNEASSDSVPQWIVFRWSSMWQGGPPLPWREWRVGQPFRPPHLLLSVVLFCLGRSSSRKVPHSLQRSDPSRRAL